MAEWAIIIRGVVLAIAVLSFLQATVLFRFTQRRLLEPWFALGERRGAPVPPLLRDERVRRGWAILMTVAFAGLWWYLGTPAGVEMLRAFRPG